MRPLFDFSLSVHHEDVPVRVRVHYGSVKEYAVFKPYVVGVIPVADREAALEGALSVEDHDATVYAKHISNCHLAR